MTKGETKVTETKTENLSDALLWLVRSLSKLFLVSILGSMVAVSLAMGVGEACPQHEIFELVKVPFESRPHDVPDSGKKVEVGPYELPLSALPLGCVVFAALMLWLTRARMRTIEDVLRCDDTRPLARVLFRINPPLLDVINTGKSGQPALLSGPSVLLYNWSLFFGCSVKLILLAASFGDIDLRPVVFVVYLVLIVFIMVLGVLAVTQPLRAIADKVHGCNRPRPHCAWACVPPALAAAAFAGAISLT